MTGGSRAAQPVVVGQSDLDDDDADADADSDSGVDVERWQDLARRSLETEGISTGELSLLFIDTEAMAALNAVHMGASGPTDVLAFPIDGEGHSSDQVVPRPRLTDALYGAGQDVSDRTLDSHLRNLRSKLAEAGCGDAIETVHGVGFRLGACTSN